MMVPGVILKELEHRITNTMPDTYILRGNAFSESEVTDSKVISTLMKDLLFDGLMICEIKHETAKKILLGEVYLLKNGQELIYDIELMFPEQDVPFDELKISSYVINALDNLIVVEFQQ